MSIPAPASTWNASTDHMDYIKEKVAYLKGLSDGLGLDDSTNEGKVILQMLEVLGDITDALDGLAEAQDELQDYVETIDDDMTDLEEYILENEGYDLDDDDDDEEGDDVYEVICPKCGAAYLADFESFEDDEVFCPECGEQFVIESKVMEKLTNADECGCGEKHQ